MSATQYSLTDLDRALFGETFKKPTHALIPITSLGDVTWNLQQNGVASSLGKLFAAHRHTSPDSLYSLLIISQLQGTFPDSQATENRLSVPGTGSISSASTAGHRPISFQPKLLVKGYVKQLKISP